MGMVLICGVHGVGKTNFADELCKTLSLRCYTAGKLIQGRTDKLISVHKKVKEISANQDLLLDALCEIKEARYILNGHLCLINDRNMIEKIPFEVFERMHIESLYIVVDRPRIIKSRLQIRDSERWNESLIENFQKEEISYALELAQKLCVPLNIIYENRQISSFAILGSHNIILPIKPIYADKILNGEKRYEYRKRLCKKDPSKIYFYATSPIKKIIGEADVIQKLEMNKKDLWEKTNCAGGISRRFYDEYFAKQDLACAYQLGKTKRYKSPVTLESLGMGYVPQAFAYCGDIVES